MTEVKAVLRIASKPIKMRSIFKLRSDASRDDLKARSLTGTEN